MSTVRDSRVGKKVCGFLPYSEEAKFPHSEIKSFVSEGKFTFLLSLWSQDNTCEHISSTCILAPIIMLLSFPSKYGEDMNGT